MIHHLRWVIAAAIGLLCLDNIGNAPPSGGQALEGSKASKTEVKPGVQGQLSSRQLWLVHEATAYAFHKATGVSPTESRATVRLVESQARRYEGLDYLRVLGIIVVESKGNPWAVSPVGARGLMQIMPETGQFIARTFGEPWRGANSLHDPELNIRYGTWYLYHLRDFFPVRTNARLAAYNWGPQAVLDREMAGLGVPQIYPAQVLRAQAQIEKDRYEYHKEHYWRSLDLNRDPPCFDYDPCKPEDRPRPAEFLVHDGEGRLLR